MSAPASAPAPGSRRRRHLGTAALAGVVAALVAVVVVAGGDPDTATPLDPDNPGRDGTAALVEVLADEGVEVEVVRDADALEATPVDEGTTVVVSSTDALGASTVDRLRARSAPGLLVLLEPGPLAAELLGTPAGVTVEAGGGVPASCAAGGPLGAGDLAGERLDRLEGLRLEVDAATAYARPGCLVVEDGSLLVASGDQVVLGASQALTNDQVLRADNAALALRLLGGGERLVWYVPTLADLAADDAVSLGSLLPPWTGPALLLLLLSTVAVALWRGRRLGPLAVERLPVVVRAVETTRSRGRLYRRAGDRGHAAQVLRGSARTRLARHLGLGPAAPEAIARAAAAAAGRPVEQVAVLLAPDSPAPTTDHELTALAQDLDRLDREVRHP